MPDEKPERASEYVERLRHKRNLVAESAEIRRKLEAHAAPKSYPDVAPGAGERVLLFLWRAALACGLLYGAFYLFVIEPANAKRAKAKRDAQGFERAREAVRALNRWGDTYLVVTNAAGRTYTLDADTDGVSRVEMIHFPNGGWAEFEDCELDPGFTGSCEDTSGREWHIDGEAP